MKTIKPGDKVVWFASGKRGRIMSFRKGYGKVRRIDGGDAIIDTDSGGRVRKPLSELTLITQAADKMTA